MDEYVIVGGIVFVLILVFQAQDTNHKFSRLRTMIRFLEHQLNIANLRNLELQEECLFLRKQVHVKSVPNTETSSMNTNTWQVAWARELLELHDERITEDDLKRARKRALKKTHPDAGGHAHRFQSVENAVLVLQPLVR